MGTFRRVGTRWRCEVRHGRFYRSKTVNTKAQAEQWERETELEYGRGKAGIFPNKNLSDLLDRYSTDVSAQKRGWKKEQIRITLLQRDPISTIPLGDLSAPDIAEWRDRRLKTVSSATVNRDWNLINHAINIAINEWHWLEKNPMKSVKRPIKPPHRDRRVSDKEIELLRHCSGYDVNPDTKTSRAFLAFLFAIETGMRQGEVAGLSRSSITGRVAHLPMTKNGTKRDVPLSTRALALLEDLGEDLFDLTADQISVLFRKSRDRTGIKNLHFHDSRHEAITRLADKLDVLELARMVGIQDLKILMVYYNKTAEQLADRLG